MSEPERPMPPRRRYPQAYEKSLPIILGLLVLAIAALVALALIALARAATPGV